MFLGMKILYSISFRPLVVYFVVYICLVGPALFQINIRLFILSFLALAIFESKKFVLVLVNRFFGLIMLFLKLLATVTCCRAFRDHTIVHVFIVIFIAFIVTFL